MLLDPPFVEITSISLRRPIDNLRAFTNSRSVKIMSSQLEVYQPNTPSRNLLEDNGKALVRAVSNGNVSQVESLLQDSKMDVEVMNSKGFQPLLIAASNGDFAIVKLLIESNAKINARSKSGFTAFHVAAAQNHVDVMQYLLENGAKMHMKTPHEDTALILTARFGRLAAMNFLLQNGASINSRTRKGLNVLHVAAFHGHLSIVNYLLKDQGVDPDIESLPHGATGLYFASQKGFPGIVEAFLNASADINKTTVDNISPLYAASRNGHLSVVRVLTQQNADLETKETQHGSRALFIASCEGHTSVVKFLVKNGAHVNAKAKSGNSSLLCAVAWGFNDIIHVLLRHKANPESRNRQGYDALLVAVIQGHLDIISFFCERGSDLESKDHNGHTALHLACLLNQTQTTSFLLEKGAHVEAKSRKGETALHMASRKGLIVIIKILLEFGADIEARVTLISTTPLMLAAFHNQPNVVTFLLANGASRVARTRQKAIALHLAVMHPVNMTILENLSAKKSELNFKDSEGDTPLAYASIHGNFEAVKFLLNKGSNATIENKHGETAKDLLCTCLNFPKNYVSCARNSCDKSASVRKLRKLFE